MGNFVKSVLPRLVGQPGQDALSSLGINLTDNEGNLRDIIQVYTEVAERVKDISDSERISVVEGLAGKYHISRMQALLDDLGSADSLYRNMYQSSVDSAGSASEENEKFMESLQARINLARVEIEKMALAMGDAFLSEGMIQGIKVFGDFLNVTTKVVETIGALPLILGTVGVATVAFSSKFRTLIVALASGTTGMSSARAASAGLTTGMTGAAVATTTLSTALRGVAAATGVGLVLLGVGAAAEFLIGKMGKARELQEQIEVKNRNLIDSYSANKDTIKELAEQYAVLEDAMEQGNPSVDTQQKYFDVQKQLSELMPDLIQHEDSYGNQIFSTSAVLEKKIALLERQTEAVKRLEEAENAEARAAEITNAEKDIKNRQEQMETVLNYADAKASSLSSQYSENFYNKEIKTYDDLLKAIEHFHAKREELESQGQTRGANVMAKQAADLEKQLALYDKFSMSYDTSQLVLIEDTANKIESTIGSMNNLGDTTKSLFQNLAYDIALAADSAEDLKPLNQAFSELNLKNYNSELSNVDTLFKNLQNSSSETFTANAESLKEATKILKESLFQDLDTSTANAYGEAIDGFIAKAVQQESALRNVMKTQGKTREEALLNIQAIGDETGAIEEQSSTLNAYIDKLREKSTVEEQMVGVSQKQLDAVNDLIFMYQSLSSQSNLNREQTFLLKDAQEKLAAIYPHLSDKTGIRIKDIQKEKEAQEILLQATQLSKQGKLTAEEDMVLNSALGTQARIKNIRAEIDAILKLDNVYQQMALRQASMAAQIAKNPFNLTGNAVGLAMNSLKSYQEIIKLPSLTAELDSITSTFNGTVGSLKTSVDNASSSTDKATKSTKDSAKATKESIYITDKYKQALEAVNLEIEKQQKLRGDMTEYSKQYRDSLQKEISLEQQKTKLMKDQAASIDKQIKSGKIAQTGTISSSSSTTSTQKLSGWGGSVTSNYGTRKDPYTGKLTRHAGVDLSGARGTRLDANVSGKVVFAGKGTGKSAGFGNYVTIQSEDGLKHIYAHLDKVVATLGQTIKAGQQIGNIGSTGRSTGNHLHYQVNGANGAIDPTAYMKAAKSGKVTTSNNVASGVSNAQQDIDQAKSELLGLQGDILSSQERIKQLQLDIIDSQLAEFDNTRKLYQHTLDYEGAKQEAISKTGKEYRASIDKQITAMNGQQATNQAELAFLEKLMVTGNLSASAMANMKDRTRELKIEMQQLGTAIESANFEKIQSRMQAFDDSQDDLQFIVDLTGEYMQTLTEGSEEYNKAANEQIAAMQKQQRMIRTQIDEHKNDLATKKLSVQATNDLKEKIEDLTISYWSLSNGIKSSSESLKEANTRMKNEVADKLINVWKDYFGELKNAQMKSMDEIMKAEDKRHKQTSDNLSKELEAYKKIIQAKLDMLEKEESERDYNKEIDVLEKERLDTLSKINLLSMDDSFEARKQVAELTEKLNQTEEQIAEKRHDREIELRKENLNDLLDKKEEEIKNRQDLEDQRYEHEKELIDKQKEYWEQYYNDLLNDERKFAKLREDIIAGNTDAIKAEFGEILTYFNETMPNLENTLDGTMQAVGTSIRLNMIDNLKEALDLMSQLGKSSSGNIPNSGQFNSDKGNGSPSTSPTVPPATGSPSGTKGTGLITVTKPINLWERKRGTDDLKMLKVLQPGEQFRVYGEESRKSFGKQYDVGANRWITDIPTHIKYSKFEKGGYTGMQEGWAQLHPEEFVLNKGMTKEALKMADLFANLQRFINPLRMSGVLQPQLAGASNGDGDIVINFNVDKMNATKNEADSFSKRIADTLKRNKGVR